MVLHDNCIIIVITNHNNLTWYRALHDVRHFSECIVRNRCDCSNGEINIELLTSSHIILLMHHTLNHLAISGCTLHICIYIYVYYTYQRGTSLLWDCCQEIQS